MKNRSANGGIVAGSARLATALAAPWLILATSCGAPRPADPPTVASYGFDLGNLALPHGRVVASGMPRDGVRALVHPEVWTAQRMDAQRRRRRAPSLVPSDLVIGTVRNGQPRAWPLRFLVWHEVVNDVVGEEPVLVVHHALSGFSAVFSRRLADGSSPLFGVSGLLWNSGPLLYDRSPGGESLWSPLLGRAVAGPRKDSSATLLLLPSEVVQWADWRTRHPHTTVLAPDPALAREYRREPFGSYLGSDLLRFPVEPSWPHPRVPQKSPTLVIAEKGGFVAILHSTAASRANHGEVLAFPEAGVFCTLRLTHRPPTLAVTGPEPPPPSLMAFAFAWHAAHPEGTRWLLP